MGVSCFPLHYFTDCAYDATQGERGREEKRTDGCGVIIYNLYNYPIFAIK